MDPSRVFFDYFTWSGGSLWSSLGSTKGNLWSYPIATLIGNRITQMGAATQHSHRAAHICNVRDSCLSKESETLFMYILVCNVLER